MASRVIRFEWHRGDAMRSGHPPSALAARAAATVVALVVALTVHAAPAYGYQNQCGAGGNNFDGMLHSGDSIEGVSAMITSRTGGVCNTDTNPLNNFTNAWSMVASSNGLNWVQSGYERGYGTAVRHFSQVMSQNPYQFSTIYGSYFPYNEDHRYWQQYDPATGRILSNVDTTNFLVTQFRPLNYWPTPFQSQFFGEVRYLQSDVVGTTALKAGFWNIQTQRYDNTWQSIPCPYLWGYNDQPSRWTYQGVTCTAFHIYTYVP